MGHDERKVHVLFLPQINDKIKIRQIKKTLIHLCFVNPCVIAPI